MTLQFTVTLILAVLSLVSTTSNAGQLKRAAAKPTSKTTKQVIMPAPKPSLLSKSEQELLDEINYARTNPGAYLAFLQQYRTYYFDKTVRFPDGRSLVTNEGVSALDEAIDFLRTVKPLPVFELRKGMVMGAKVHIDDLLKTGGFGHRGSDGSLPEDRLTRYGLWEESVGEDIIYESRTARNDVIGLIIDDGVATRGHRNNIFKPGFRVIGVSVAQPSTSRRLCIVTFAGGFVDKSESKATTATKY